MLYTQIDAEILQQRFGWLQMSLLHMQRLMLAQGFEIFSGAGRIASAYQKAGFKSWHSQLHLMLHDPSIDVLAFEGDLRCEQRL